MILWISEKYRDHLVEYQPCNQGNINAIYYRTKLTKKTNKLQETKDNRYIRESVLVKYITDH